MFPFQFFIHLMNLDIFYAFLPLGSGSASVHAEPDPDPGGISLCGFETLIRLNMQQPLFNIGRGGRTSLTSGNVFFILFEPCFFKNKISTWPDVRFFLISWISINGCATGYFILNFRFLFLLEKIYGWQHQYVVLIRTTSCGNPDNKLW